MNGALYIHGLHGSRVCAICDAGGGDIRMSRRLSSLRSGQGVSPLRCCAAIPERASPVNHSNTVCKTVSHVAGGFLRSRGGFTNEKSSRTGSVNFTSRKTIDGSTVGVNSTNYSGLISIIIPSRNIYRLLFIKTWE